MEEDFKNTIPFFEDAAVPAGFPSPAEGIDPAGTRLNLHDYLIKNQTASFLVRVSGDSMIGVGIYDGDIMIGDRSEEASDGKIVVAAVHGEFTVKRLKLKNGRPILMAENPNYKPIEINPEDNFIIWGIVKHVIHKVQ